MNKKLTEVELMQSMLEAYQEVSEMARRNAGTGGGGKKAKYVQNVDNPVGHIQDDSGKKIHTGMDRLKADAASEKKKIEKAEAKQQEERRARARANKAARLKREAGE